MRCCRPVAKNWCTKPVDDYDQCYESGESLGEGAYTWFYSYRDLSWSVEHSNPPLAAGYRQMDGGFCVFAWAGDGQVDSSQCAGAEGYTWGTNPTETPEMRCSQSACFNPGLTEDDCTSGASLLRLFRTRLIAGTLHRKRLVQALGRLVGER